MTKVAVLVAPGFEEGETLTIVDILRRASIECDMVGLSEEVTGGHDITVRCDKVLYPTFTQDYEMVVLPGGYEGAVNLRDDERVIATLKEMQRADKYIAAMCAAPIVLERANLLEDKAYTAYVGYDKKIASGHFKEDIVVVDGKLITSRGPATAYAFSYALVDILGGDSAAVKDRMVYFNAFERKEDKVYA
ncbi:DJ-1 family glyoxalase III [Trichococcus alkaliphilus]|uniref:DJ-1 family glyoxalase III n=1 Tax=Trichococcus alkaliphilus TaxID=2052943 RepID=UPI000D0B1ED6|nr:DJ-1 family glyoxalase III [Trichococcus alkaliphilus]